MRTLYAAGLAPILLALLLLSRSQAAPATASAPAADATLQAAIESASTPNEWRALAQKVEEAIREMTEEKAQATAERLCKRMTARWRTAEARSIASRVAFAALTQVMSAKSGEQVPASLELLNFLLCRKSEAQSQEQWEKHRLSAVTLWLHAWMELYSMAEKAVPHDPPLVADSPGEGTSGVGSVGMKGPGAPTWDEMQSARARQIAENRVQRAQIRMRLEDMTDFAVSFISAAYGGDVENKELEAVLNTMVTSPDARAVFKKSLKKGAGPAHAPAKNSN